jgi:hypothetical protein
MVRLWRAAHGALWSHHRLAPHGGLCSAVQVFLTEFTLSEGNVFEITWGNDFARAVPVYFALSTNLL